jgi:serine/threonine-protein kinase
VRSSAYNPGDVTLQPGTRLGAYEIAARIGAGGMGEVYRATDTTLRREVAVKVLPEAVAADPERLARFRREAEVLASLNHPNIATVFGLEHEGATTALVMELVEGPTLADRIATGPLPLDEALAIARQITAALEVAHARGIVHRDLKPANVSVRPDGTVKVLDFGLAKAIAPAGAEALSGLSQSPTITTPAMTQAGLILGTAAYMAPEQARGKPVDARADIWAFGCVLFEMLSGVRAFGGDDITDTIAGVVAREPAWDALPDGLPAPVRRLLGRSLRKDPKERLHHIADARLELDAAGGEAESAPAVPPRTRLTPGTAALALAGLLLAVVAGVQTWRLAGVDEIASRLVRFEIPLPAGMQPGALDAPLATVSPDGSRIVLSYDAGDGVGPQLYSRRLDGMEVLPIPGTEGARAPFFSPDGRWLAFTVRDEIRRMSVDGGAVLPVVAAEFGAGTWLPDDTVVYTPNYAAGLWRVSASGGDARMLTEPSPADGELGHWWPQVLPGGDHVLFTNYRSPAERSRIEVYSLATGTRTAVAEGFFGRYVPGGHLLVTRGTTVLVAPFDIEALRTTGPEVPALADVAVFAPAGMVQMSASAEGTLAYVSQDTLASQRRLVWLDRNGQDSPAADQRGVFNDVKVSPSGDRASIVVTEGSDTDLWVYEFARGTLNPVSSTPGIEATPVWDPAGRRLFFTLEDRTFQIHARTLDGRAESELVLEHPFDVYPQAVSPDGRWLVYRRGDPSTRGGLWLLSLTGDAEERRFADDPSFREEVAVLSPGGEWLAYTSNESGRFEVWVERFPDGGDRVRVSTGGGTSPAWSADGGELYFREGDRMMVAALGDGLVDRPSLLFERRLLNYDVAPDGRFIAVLPDENAAPPVVDVVLNWFEELRRLSPVD